ncbi:MAG TPA: 50S ribosomal protein L13 [Methylomirabilota bacterium]|jgi:large subunit ribosomal protein L13|nr:50S ribosomal protein L13 [Methylomirabilota bacterium]
MKKETDTLSRASHLNARRWHLIDAKGKTVGRLASTIAGLLRGKHNPSFSPHLDCGDFVVVINARHVVFSGNKLKDKIYYRHTEHPGGIRMTSAEHLLSTRPEEVLRKAITGMLPKTPLGRKMSGKVKIYPDATHPHTAQQPAVYAFGE